MLITTNEAIENLNTILNLLNDLKLACKATLAYVKQRCIGSKPLAELFTCARKSIKCLCSI